MGEGGRDEKVVVVHIREYSPPPWDMNIHVLTGTFLLIKIENFV